MRFSNLHGKTPYHPSRCVGKGGIHKWAPRTSTSQRPTHQRQWNNGVPKGSLVLAISPVVPRHLLCWRIQEDHHLLNNSYTQNPDRPLQTKNNNITDCSFGDYFSMSQSDFREITVVFGVVVDITSVVQWLEKMNLLCGAQLRQGYFTLWVNI